MSDVHVVLSQNERELLVRLLEAAMKEKRIEVRRTEFSRDYRHDMEAEETQIHALLDKLAQSSG